MAGSPQPQQPGAPQTGGLPGQTSPTGSLQQRPRKLCPVMSTAAQQAGCVEHNCGLWSQAYKACGLACGPDAMAAGFEKLESTFDYMTKIMADIKAKI
ncbi:MAG: hypothetical protein FJY99_06930 [Candidatus Sericytochromatia bacterium]|nr:hypothetical protein [Candidatus Tanganyikabacteria bacterium]